MPDHINIKPGLSVQLLLPGRDLPNDDEVRIVLLRDASLPLRPYGSEDSDEPFLGDEYGLDEARRLHVALESLLVREITEHPEQEGPVTPPMLPVADSTGSPPFQIRDADGKLVYTVIGSEGGIVLFTYLASTFFSRWMTPRVARHLVHNLSVKISELEARRKEES